jgi:hypothetical protein
MEKTGSGIRKAGNGGASVLAIEIGLFISTISALKRAIRGSSVAHMWLFSLILVEVRDYCCSYCTVKEVTR